MHDDLRRTLRKQQSEPVFVQQGRVFCVTIRSCFYGGLRADDGIKADKPFFVSLALLTDCNQNTFLSTLTFK